MQATAARQKKTVSVTLEPMLVQQAKDAGINLSATLTEALQSKLKASAAEEWKRQNRAGIQELNRITEEHGLLSDEYRTF